MSIRKQGLVAVVTLICVVMSSASVWGAEAVTLESTSLGSIRNIHRFGPTLLCGQPSQEDLQLAREQGIRTIVTLRGEDEIDWDEQRVAESLGLELKRIDFRGPETLTDEVFDASRQALREAEAGDRPVMLHCGSANRVGAVWLVHRVLDDGVSWEAAEQEARTVGLRTEGYLVRAKKYVAGRSQGN